MFLYVLTCAITHCVPAAAAALLLLLLQMERARQTGSFQQLLKAAIQESLANNGNELLCWRWFACDACQKWRLVSHGACYMMGLPLLDGLEPEGEAKPFACGTNFDRLGGLGCAEPEEWVEQG
jgi:hypothetical protein